MNCKKTSHSKTSIQIF